MESTTVKLYSLRYNNAKTYLVASLFIIGNLLLPQLFHLMPQGGITWLPIYFFTLIGAYKYGWKVGLLTAILSPVINSLLFGFSAVELSALLSLVSSFGLSGFTDTAFAILIAAYPKKTML